jgi:sugar O-acyltransferase (sialic acid O-acetyltransferase NeuD family)
VTTLGIVGAGGHGREAHAVAVGSYDTVLFVDDRARGLGADEVERFGRLGASSVIAVADLAARCDEYVIAIGDPAVRRSVAERIGSGPTEAVLVAEAAWLGTDVELAGGVMIYPGATVTTNVRVGRHSHVNCGAVVSHDSRVGAFVSLSPGVLLNGETTVEDGAFLGSGAIVLPGRTIGQGAVVGAGAVVTTDVAPGTTVVGVPAR